MSKKSYNNQTDATAEDYLEHASEVNTIAGKTLRLETKDATAISAKISIGLSLQAAELAGKGMLRAFGHSVTKIRQRHRNHNLLKLLKEVDQELQHRPEKELTNFHHFLLQTPTVDGKKYGNTIAAYFKDHFSKGASAFPRSYFYPDKDVFTGPIPIHAIFFMVKDIIEVAEKVIKLIKH